MVTEVKFLKKDPVIRPQSHQNASGLEVLSQARKSKTEVLGLA